MATTTNQHEWLHAKFTPLGILIIRDTNDSAIGNGDLGQDW
jgi:hypothetical protein